MWYIDIFFILQESGIKGFELNPGKKIMSKKEQEELKKKVISRKSFLKLKAKYFIFIIICQYFQLLIIF